MTTVQPTEPEPAHLSTVVKSTSYPARIHPRADELSAETYAFFLETWPFTSQGQRDLFVRSNLPLGLCATIPDGDFERTGWSCRLIVLLFLLDDWFEKRGRC
ncbi:hypothetical protein DFH09DRAFT_1182403 [Mycena vulgaris]|nr:hypothetical protein DFH09DRAFT_1182403 [Mycena vulgaris]